MKKIFWFALALAMTFAFVACDTDDGPSMNEAYAGTWYEVDEDGEHNRYDMTDSTYESSEWDGTAYLPLEKGVIEKLSATQYTSQMTEHYLTTANAGGITIPEADEGWYDKAEMLQYGIDNGYWTDEAGMAADGPDYVTVYTMTYEVSADGTTMTSSLIIDGTTYAATYVSVDPAL